MISFSVLKPCKQKPCQQTLCARMALTVFHTIVRILFKMDGVIFVLLMGKQIAFQFGLCVAYSPSATLTKIKPPPDQGHFFFPIVPLTFAQRKAAHKIRYT